MKKVIFLMIALVMVAGSVNAGPKAYVGVYSDANHATCRVNVAAPFTLVTAWVWVLPNDQGMKCTELMVTAAAGAITTLPVINPGKSVTYGDSPYTGFSICFTNCQTAWVWLYQLPMYITAPGVPDFVRIVNHPVTGTINVTDCTPGFPIRPLTILNHLALNQDCIIANEDASWGAIKGMYNE